MQQIIPAIFYKKIIKKETTRNLIFHASLELTPKCNLNCVHCYMKEWSTTELNTAQWKKIIDELHKNGCLFILLTGGEVLLRPDFSELYLYLKQKGIAITVFSNGTLLNSEHIKLFKEWPPMALDITVHGFSKETYGKVTGKPELFHLMKKNINLLAQNHIPFGLKISLLNENKLEFWAIKDWATELGVKFRYDTYIHARRNGDTTPFKHRIAPMESALLENEENAEKFDSFFCEIETKNNKSSNFASSRYFHCNVENIRNRVFISAAGTLAPCNAFVPWGIPFNFSHTNFITYRPMFWNHVYKNPPFEKERMDGCISCQYRNICPACGIPASYELHTKTKPAEFCCDLCFYRNKIWKLKKGEKQNYGKFIEEGKKEIYSADYC